LKSEEDITQAHDFVSFVLGSHSAGIDEGSILDIIIMRDTLCWTLEHESTEFSDSLALMQERIFGLQN